MRQSKITYKQMLTFYYYRMLQTVMCCICVSALAGSYKGH